MSASTLSPELESYRANCMAALGAVTAEPMVDAAPFNRRGLYTNKALGKFGFVPYLMGKAQAKSQAGGLPEQFILAVGETKIHAFAYKASGRKRDRFEVGAELATWDRGSLRASWQNGPPYQIDVTLTPAAGEEILIRGGRTAWTENVLGLLAG